MRFLTLILSLSLSALLSLGAVAQSPEPREKASSKNDSEARVKTMKPPLKQGPGAKKETSEDKISNTETEKPIFEKKDEPEPGTWRKIKEKSGDALDQTVEFASEQSQSVRQGLAATRARRSASKWTINADYSLFEMWVLSRYGLTVGYHRSPSSTYELEYMRGSLGFGYFGVDIGAIDEEKLALNWRSYGQRNSFHFISGLYYNKLDAHLGNKMLSSVAPNLRTQVNLLELETVGVSWGLGNRWQTKRGFTWGADWLVINVPVWIVKQSHPYLDASQSEKDRDNAGDTLRILRRVPALAALKIQLGFTF